MSDIENPKSVTLSGPQFKALGSFLAVIFVLIAINLVSTLATVFLLASR